MKAQEGGSVGGRREITEDEAREVLARGGDRKWAVDAEAKLKTMAVEGAESPARKAGRLAALTALLIPPKVRRSKEEVAKDKAEREKRKAEKEAKKAAAAKAAAKK